MVSAGDFRNGVTFEEDGNVMHLNNTITKVAVGSDESK